LILCTFAPDVGPNPVDNVRALPAPLSIPWPRVGHALTVVGVVYVALAIAGLAGIGGCNGGEIVACDAAAYYYADGYNPVSITPQYGYSPAFAWAFAPFRLLPFDAFVWVWAGLHVAALLWLRAGWFLAIPGVNEDVIRGNVTVFVALAVVLALTRRSPIHAAAWTFPLLTKVLPGVGVIWHMARREWTALAVALGSTLAVVAIGALVAPQLWVEWVELLSGEGTGTAGSLVPRLILAAGIVAYAGLTSRAWLVPVGMLVGWSYLWLPAFMVLAAIPRLRSPDPSMAGLDAVSRSPSAARAHHS
jgi:hypothetical protein